MYLIEAHWKYLNMVHLQWLTWINSFGENATISWLLTNLGVSAAIWCAGSWYTSKTKRTWQEWPGRCASRSANTRETKSAHGECWKNHYCRVLSGSTHCMSKLISRVNWKWSWPMWIQHMEKFFQKIIELCQTRQHLRLKYIIRLHHNCGACDYWQFLPSGTLSVF